MEFKDYAIIASLILGVLSLGISARSLRYSKFRALMSIKDSNLEAAIKNKNTTLGKLHKEMSEEAFLASGKNNIFNIESTSKVSVDLNIKKFDMEQIRKIASTNADVNLDFNLKSRSAILISLLEIFSPIILAFFIGSYIDNKFISVVILVFCCLPPLFFVMTSRYDCFFETMKICFREKFIYVSSAVTERIGMTPNKIGYSPDTAILTSGSLLERGRKIPLLKSVAIRDSDVFFNILGVPNWYALLFSNEFNELIDELNLVIGIFSDERGKR